MKTSRLFLAIVRVTIVAMLFFSGNLLSFTPPPTLAASATVTISQIYGGGGNGGATYQNDFIELYNRGTTPVSIDGWSVQYASATGTNWSNTTAISGTIQPGHYYLIQEAHGANGVSLPTPDAIGTTNMSGTAGKVALVSSTGVLSCTTGCETEANVVDFVGYGTTANMYEGAGPAPAPSNTTAVLRKGNGAVDTDQNQDDFVTGTPLPRNSAASQPVIALCGTTPLTTTAGQAVSRTLNAYDYDGIVNSATLTGVIPVPASGSITLANIMPATAAGGTLTATLSVDSAVPAGTYTATVQFSNNDTPVPQTASCDVVINVISTSPALQVAASPAILLENEGASASTGILTRTNTTSGTITVNLSVDRPDKISVPPTVTIPDGAASVTFTIGTIDNAVQDGTIAVMLAATAAGYITGSTGLTVYDDESMTPVYQIQGSGMASPYINQIVTTTGIIVGLTGSGFYLQDPVGDNNAATSDGVYVFRSSKSFGFTPSIGDEVIATGEVTEYFDLTELDVSKTGSQLQYYKRQAPLPAPTVLTPTGVLTDLEKYEGMLVQFGAGANHCATVVAPTNNFYEYYVVLSETNISKVFHGDPASILNQVLMINDADSATVGRRESVKTGDTVCGIVGPLTYNFDNYKIEVQKDTTPAITPGPALDTPVGGGLTGNQFSLSNFNVENFFDTVNDPNTSDDVVTAAEFVTKTTKLALAIHDKLSMPVLLGMEEVENSTVLDALVARPELGGKYSYVWRDSVDPRGIDVALLYQPSRVTILDVKQYQCYTSNDNNDDLNNIYNCAAGDPPVITGTTRLYPRQPLIVKLRVTPESGVPLTMTVIVNHFRSQIASAGSCPNSPGNNCTYYRLNESLYLNRYISNTLAASGETNIAIVGDFNEFTDSATIQAIKNGLLPNPGVNNGEPVTGGLPFHLLTTEVPRDRQYSYVFDGVHQTLDHILVSNNLYSLFRSADYAHFDADYPFYKDASSHALADDISIPNRVSDHDPAIAIFANSYYHYLPLTLRNYQAGW